MAQRCNHLRKKQKPSFNGKDHLKLLLSQCLTQDFISCLHCAIDTSYWFQLNPMEKTQCLQHPYFSKGK